MASNLNRLVEEAIDRCIRECSPEEPASYAEFADELTKIESRITSTDDFPEKVALLSRVRTLRVNLASQAGLHEDVLSLSAKFLRRYPDQFLDYSTVAIVRVEALHALDRHENECRETREIAQRSECRGTQFALLVARVAKRHPGGLDDADGFLVKKTMEVVGELRGTSYPIVLPKDLDRKDLESLVITVAAEVQRISAARTLAVLSDDEAE